MSLEYEISNINVQYEPGIYLMRGHD